MNEDKSLVPSGLLQRLFVADFVHVLEMLDRFLLGDADELLLQSTRPEGDVKLEETLLLVDAEEHRDVLVVR